jgi:hypothetical protein
VDGGPGLRVYRGLPGCPATTGAHNIVATFSSFGGFADGTSAVGTQVVTKVPCASLAGCNLAVLDLSGANLTGATLVGANLTGANLNGANLAGATMTGANLNKVTWSDTTCPDGTNSNADGAPAPATYDKAVSSPGLIQRGEPGHPVMTGARTAGWCRVVRRYREIFASIAVWSSRRPGRMFIHWPRLALTPASACISRASSSTMCRFAAGCCLHMNLTGEPMA